MLLKSPPRVRLAQCDNADLTLTSIATDIFTSEVALLQLWQASVPESGMPHAWSSTVLLRPADCGCCRREACDQRDVPRPLPDAAQHSGQAQAEPFETGACAASGPGSAADAGQMPATPARTEPAAAGMQSPAGTPTPQADTSQAPAPAGSRAAARPVQPGPAVNPQQAATAPVGGTAANGAPAVSPSGQPPPPQQQGAVPHDPGQAATAPAGGCVIGTPVHFPQARPP